MMLHTRAYAGLILACSLIALLAAVLVTHFLPQYLWLGIGVPTIILTAIVLTIRPEQGNPVLEFIEGFEDAPAGLLLLDLEGRVEWANRSIESMLNQPRGALIGEPLSALLGDAWDTLQGRRTQLLNGERIDLEGQFSTTTDHKVWCRAHAKLLKTHRDRPRHVIMQILDLSAARDAQSAVTESQTRLARTLDLTTDLVIKADYSGRIVYANAAANRVLASNQPLPGQNVLQYLASDDRKPFAEGFKRAQIDGEPPATFTRLGLVPGGRSTSGTDVHRVSASITRMNETPPVLAVVCRDTDEQLTSLDQLRSSEARFSRIFHSSPDAILIVRQSDSLILDFNSGFTQLLGYTREQAIGELESDLDLFVDPQERQDVIDSLGQAAEITNLETRLKTVTGQPVYVEISLRYIEIDGEFCTLCIGRDINSRKLAEAALRASEEKFEQVFRRSPDGIVILRQNNLTIYDINDSFLEASDYAREELVDQSIYDLRVFDQESSLTEAAEELAANGFFSNREMVLHTKAGEPVQTLVSGTFIDIDNEPCVLCIAKNVNELREAEEKLRQSEQRFRGAFENSPVGIVLLDLEGTIFQANNFASEILGFDERPLEGMHISRLIPREDRSGFKDALNDLLDGQQEAIRSEQRMVRGDMLEVWTTFHLVMQRDTSGEPYYLIAQIADISEMKSSQSRMERMAFYDTLTNLANRRLFYDRLGQAVDHVKRSDHLAALLYLDLDQFKRVNDTLGHEMGDQLLQKIATRLSGCVRQEDTVARLGGDEFTVLLFQIGSPIDASLVADKILKRLREPLTISGHQLVITTSIGITIAPQDGTDPNSLMKNADLAMYRAKEHGRNIYQFYSEEMNTNAIKRLRIEYEVRQALERHEFELYYQPKVCLTTQQVVGVECLIRWNHPERGLLSPFEFIEVAEETGAIVDMGTWIIQEACRTGRTLCEQAGRNVQIAINISPRQFKDSNLVATIRRNLRETGLDPATLEIEITETMLMADVEAANQTVHKLHELGVRLAIDDFGTGYSSLNYLKKFPINTVKVDRSFVMDIPDSEDDMAITSAVIAMAHRLNMEVVAEGVETRDQLEFLIRHHCEYAQGFLFSKPLPLADVRHMIQPNVRLLGSR